MVADTHGGGTPMPESGESRPGRFVDIPATTSAVLIDPRLPEADPTHALTTFVEELFPHRHQVRAAAPDGRGGWVNRYPEGMSLGEARKDPNRPVVIYATGKRGRGVSRFIRWAGDFDAKQHSPAQAASDAAEYAAIHVAAGGEPVPALSGPSGGWHIWSGCVAGCSFETIDRINRAGQALWRTWDKGPLNVTSDMPCIRPPGSPHRDGGHSRLTRHTVEEAVYLIGEGSPGPEFYAEVADRMEALAAARGLAVAPKPTEAEGEEPGPRTVPDSIRLDYRSNPKRPVVRPVVRQVIADAEGHPMIAGVALRALGKKAAKSLAKKLTDDHDWSKWYHAPLTAMAVNGWTWPLVVAAVADEANSPALEWLRSYKNSDGTRIQRSDDDRTAVLTRAWWLAVQDAARLPKRPQDDPGYGELSKTDAAVADLLQRMDAAGEARWTRESGPVDYAVLCALAWMMVTAQSLEVSAPVWRLAALIGRSQMAPSRSLPRLIRDGWINETAAADEPHGIARRVTLADAHQCPEDDTDRYHWCAVYCTTEDNTPVHAGCYRSANAAPPSPSSPLWQNPRGQLPTFLIHAQNGLWHELGHHAARTHRAILQPHRRLTLASLAQATGYSVRTVRRHVRRLAELGLVALSTSARGTVIKALRKPLQDAARQVGTGGRVAAVAVAALVARAVHLWWIAEVEWCALSAEEKRRRGRRRAADQLVLSGMPGGHRAFPRRLTGEPDYRRAGEIEGERIGAEGLAAHALQLADAGELVDPAYLSPTGAQAPPSKPGRRSRPGKRRRTAGPARTRRGVALQPALPGLGEPQRPRTRAKDLSCPRCDARAGQPCTSPTTGDQLKSTHQGRRTKADRLNKRPPAGTGPERPGTEDRARHAEPARNRP